MSGAEAETVDAEADGAPDPDKDEGDRPPIEEDEVAEVDLSDLADEVEEETTPDSAAEESQEAGQYADESEDGAAPLTGDETPQEPAEAGETWGDLYVDTLGTLLYVLSEELGEDEPSRDAEDIASLARQNPMRLDDRLNTVLEESDRGINLPPEWALLLGSGALVLVVLLTETDLASDAVERMQEEIDL